MIFLDLFCIYRFILECVTHWLEKYIDGNNVLRSGPNVGYTVSEIWDNKAYLKASGNPRNPNGAFDAFCAPKAKKGQNCSRIWNENLKSFCNKDFSFFTFMSAVVSGEDDMEYDPMNNYYAKVAPEVGND